LRCASDPRVVASGGGVTPVPLEDSRSMNEARPPGLRLADLDAAAINRLIPHRYPFLMIDRVVEIFADTSAIGIKSVTVNEPFFPGHFPGHPIMPGVLIVEAMAQTAAALVAASVGADAEGKLVYFTTIEQARFRRPVVPGDQLRIKVIKQQKKLGIWKFAGLASVEDNTAAEAIISAKIMDPPAS
jgi:3-hydroxyacyl-[acyl-carrier-protein] dehydratase